jgi:hypothetical protein
VPGEALEGALSVYGKVDGDVVGFVGVENEEGVGG